MGGAASREADFSSYSPMSAWPYADHQLRRLIVDADVVDAAAVHARLDAIASARAAAHSAAAASSPRRWGGAPAAGTPVDPDEGRLDGRGTPDEPLWFSVLRRCDAATIRRFIDLGVPHSFETHGEAASTLSIAIYRNDPEVLRTVLAADVRRCLRAPGTWPWVAVAAYRGAAAAFIGMSERTELSGVANETANDGITPLMLAAGRGHAPCVNILLRNAADAAAQVYDGGALHACARGPRYWYCGDRAIDSTIVALARRKDSVASYASYRDVGGGDDIGTRHRMRPDDVPRYAVPPPTGYTDVVRALLAAHVPVDVPTRAGRTPLMLALQNDNVPVVEALLAAGANVMLADSSAMTVIEYARGAKKSDTPLPATREAALTEVQAWLAGARVRYDAAIARINAITSSNESIDWSKEASDASHGGAGTVTAAAGAGISIAAAEASKPPTAPPPAAADVVPPVPAVAHPPAVVAVAGAGVEPSSAAAAAPDVDSILRNAMAAVAAATGAASAGGASSSVHVVVMRGVSGEDPTEASGMGSGGHGSTV